MCAERRSSGRGRIRVLFSLVYGRKEKPQGWASAVEVLESRLVPAGPCARTARSEREGAARGTVHWALGIAAEPGLGTARAGTRPDSARLSQTQSKWPDKGFERPQHHSSQHH